MIGIKKIFDKNVITTRQAIDKNNGFLDFSDKAGTGNRTRAPPRNFSFGLLYH